MALGLSSDCRLFDLLEGGAWSVHPPEVDVPEGAHKPAWRMQASSPIDLCHYMHPSPRTWPWKVTSFFSRISI
jgi:hypothetical protein